MIKQIARYAVVGVSNTLIDFAVLNLLIQVFHWALVPANTVAVSLAVTNSYLLNNYWTFHGRQSSHLRQVPLFLAINVFWVIFSDTLVHYGTLFVGGLDTGWPYVWQYNLAKAVVVLLMMLLNFVFYKYVVFNAKP